MLQNTAKDPAFEVPQGTEGELGLDEDYTLLVKAGGAAARAPSPGKASTYDWQASQRGHLVRAAPFAPNSVPSSRGFVYALQGVPDSLSCKYRTCA